MTMNFHRLENNKFFLWGPLFSFFCGISQITAVRFDDLTADMISLECV